MGGVVEAKEQNSEAKLRTTCAHPLGPFFKIFPKGAVKFSKYKPSLARVTPSELHTTTGPCAFAEVVAVTRSNRSLSSNSMNMLYSM